MILQFHQKFCFYHLINGLYGIKLTNTYGIIYISVRARTQDTHNSLSFGTYVTIQEITFISVCLVRFLKGNCLKLSVPIFWLSVKYIRKVVRTSFFYSRNLYALKFSPRLIQVSPEYLNFIDCLQKSQWNSTFIINKIIIWIGSHLFSPNKC